MEEFFRERFQVCMRALIFPMSRRMLTSLCDRAFMIQSQHRAVRKTIIILPEEYRNRFFILLYYYLVLVFSIRNYIR